MNGLFRSMALATCVLTVWLTATPSLAQDDKWVSLFDGKSLDGWEKVGNEESVWEVKDGALCGSGPASMLVCTKGPYKNFRYRAEIKINDKGNSGQYFRTKFEGGFPAGYEAQINATHGDWRRTGSLYPDGRTKLRDFEKDICVKDAPNKPDEFFVQEVIAVGDHIQIFVNGKKTVDFKDPNKTFTKGHFALQGHDPGSVMTFKKVEYKPIKK